MVRNPFASLPMRISLPLVPAAPCSHLPAAGAILARGGPDGECRGVDFRAALPVSYAAVHRRGE